MCNTDLLTFIKLFKYFS